MTARCARDLFDGCLGSVELDGDQVVTLLDGTRVPVAPEPDPDTGRVDWIEEPEGDGLICRVCARQEELDEHDAAQGRVEIAIAAERAREWREG